jgi:hypothetical protein
MMSFISWLPSLYSDSSIDDTILVARPKLDISAAKMAMMSADVKKFTRFCDGEFRKRVMKKEARYVCKELARAIRKQQSFTKQDTGNARSLSPSAICENVK